MGILSSYERVGHLKIDVADGIVNYHFSSGQLRFEASQPVSVIDKAVTLTGGLDGRFFCSGTTSQQVRDVAESFVGSAVPEELVSSLRQWNEAHARSTLTVAVGEPWLSDLPWELISAVLGGRLFVVRVGEIAESGAEPCIGEITMLLAAWSVQPNGHKLPGVMRELGQLPAQMGSAQVRIAPLHAPSLDQFRAKATEIGPNVVHIVTANGFGSDVSDLAAGDDWRQATRPESPTYLWLDPLPAAQISSDRPQSPLQRLKDDDLIALLHGVTTLRLCVINTMPNPPVANSPFYRRLSTELGVTIVGWNGAIDDSIALDFSLFLYRRITEGSTLPDAVRSFAEQFGDTQWVAGAIPTIWVPTDRWIDQPVMVGEASSEAPEHIVSRSVVAEALALPKALGSAGWRRVAIDFIPQESLFPALLMNGQEAIRALTLTAQSTCDVRLEVACDTGGRGSVYGRIRTLVPGPNTIDVRELGFPVLYELLQCNEPRIVNFQVSVWLAGDIVDQVTRSVRWRACREWLDSDESYAYLPSFVIPMTQAVATLVRNAETVLTQIAGPQESFSGYRRDQASRAEMADRQVQSIFQALRGWNLKYITPPGTPVYVIDPSDDPTRGPAERSETNSQVLVGTSTQSGQFVRFPDEVVERGHATCHDLALLFAAALEYVNLRPIIVILPGHTLVGFWVDDADHDQFWLGRAVTPSTGFGATWKLMESELRQLVEGGKINMVETTMVTNTIATYEQAKRRGVSYLQQDVRAAIDVRRSRESIQALSLA